MALPKDNVTIFGIGRLGICTALVLEQQGKYNVVGVDTNESYVKAIQNKTFRTTEPMVNEYLARSTNFKATTDFDEGIAHSDTCDRPRVLPFRNSAHHIDFAAISSLLLHRPLEARGTMTTACSAMCPPLPQAPRFARRSPRFVGRYS